MDSLLLVILATGITLVTISWLKSELQCPPPEIIYRFIPKHQIDVQFSEENRPSKVHSGMFLDSNVFLAGRSVGNGKNLIHNKFS